MNKWLFHQNGFTRTSLSATVTQVSNFVEENVCLFVFYIVKALRRIQSLIAKQVKYVNAISMFKALNKGFK